MPKIIFPMQKNGFTLIEVLIFTTLISFIFITLSSLSLASLVQTKVAKNKVLATHYGEELREWLRGRKEVDWISFKNTYTTTSNFCFNNSPIPSTVTGNGFACAGNNCETDPACSFQPTYSPLPLGKRFVRFTHIGFPDNIQVIVTVSWKERGTYSVPINTIFTQFE